MYACPLTNYILGVHIMGMLVLVADGDTLTRDGLED